MSDVTPLFNDEYDFPVFRADILSVIPNEKYRMLICWEKGDCLDITPTITLPMKKGHMLYKGEMIEYMLSTCNTPTNPTSEIEIVSTSGFVDISYHCRTTDYRGISYWGSSKVLRNLGMRREVVSPSKMRYMCTDLASRDFSCYIFTIEWLLSDK